MIEIRCHFCGQPVNANRSSYRRVQGWERKGLGETRKGGSDVLLREPLDEWAHASCVSRIRAGLSVGQESLL
jgi:hypothetical protein